MGLVYEGSCAIRKPRDICPALMLALHAGMRDAEIRGLQWGRVDLTGGRDCGRCKIGGGRGPDHSTERRRSRRAGRARQVACEEVRRDAAGVVRLPVRPAWATPIGPRLRPAKVWSAARDWDRPAARPERASDRRLLHARLTSRAWEVEKSADAAFLENVGPDHPCAPGRRRCPVAYIEARLEAVQRDHRRKIGSAAAEELRSRAHAG